jgi:serine/threonine protein kinase
VAIKIIPLTDTDADELAAIQREIQFLAGCNHPNIVKYLVRVLCGHARACWRKIEG